MVFVQHVRGSSFRSARQFSVAFQAAQRVACAVLFFCRVSKRDLGMNVRRGLDLCRRGWAVCGLFVAMLAFGVTGEASEEEDEGFFAAEDETAFAGSEAEAPGGACTAGSLCCPGDKPSPYRIYHSPHPVRARLRTSLGEVCCDLHIEGHPLTVLNFMALATGNPGWGDRAGQVHVSPYYVDIPFGHRVAGAYVVSGSRPEGEGFVVRDERCKGHGPVAGSLAMVQSHPGLASASFMLLARDIPEFAGMYAVFGQCSPLSVIGALTAQEAVLFGVEIDDMAACGVR